MDRVGRVQRECGIRARTLPTRVHQPSTAPSKDARKTILFVGTSLTAGYGIDPQQAYPALIQARLDSLGLNYEAINAGVSGETSAGAVHRMDWLLKQPIDVFVLETGANDGLRGLTVDSLRANIQQILDDVKRTHPNAKVLLIGMEAPPNMGRAYVNGFRTVYSGARESESRGVSAVSAEGGGWCRLAESAGHDSPESARGGDRGGNGVGRARADCSTTPRKRALDLPSPVP